MHGEFTRQVSVCVWGRGGEGDVVGEWILHEYMNEYYTVQQSSRRVLSNPDTLF